MRCRFYGFPATTNPELGAAIMRTAASAVVGESGIRSGRDIMTMGGEDFSVYLQHKPGCFVFVGATAPDAEATPHHHPSFQIDERSLAIGASLWIQLIDSLLITQPTV
jgi:amidohydrolase